MRQPPGDPMRQPPGDPMRQSPGEYQARRSHAAGQPPVQRPPVRVPPPDPGEGHGHSHSHDADLVVSRRTRKVVHWILIPCALLVAVALVLLWPHRVSAPTQPQDTREQRAYGEVLQVHQVPCPDGLITTGPPMPCGKAMVHGTSGAIAGQNLELELPQGPGAPTVRAGDKVVLYYLPDMTGKGDDQWAIGDHQRGNQLLIMVIICALVVVIFGRLRGFAALIGLAASFVVLLLFIIPAILEGQSPLLVAIVGSTAIMFFVLYLTHGFTMHTSVAVLGTLASLVVTGLVGVLFTISTSLTGFADEEDLYVWMMNEKVDLRGLLLAGMIIGALGVLDDVTVTQSATIAELARTATSRMELFRSGLEIGRQHVGAVVNTLVLAYAGTSLPLLLLISTGGMDISDLLSGELIGREIVRAVVGMIGLVSALVAELGGRQPSARPRGDRPDREHWAEAVSR